MSLQPVPTSLPAHSSIRGVMAYLNAVLPEDTLRVFREFDLSTFREAPGFRPEELKPATVFWNAPQTLHAVRRQIGEVFVLERGYGVLCEELSSFHLYSEWDRAEALFYAFALHSQGLDIRESFVADYSPSGIFWHFEPEQYHVSGKPDWWEKFKSDFQEGDRFLNYFSPTYAMVVLFRGHRIVKGTPKY